MLTLTTVQFKGDGSFVRRRKEEFHVSGPYYLAVKLMKMEKQVLTLPLALIQIHSKSATEGEWSKISKNQ